MISNSNFFGGVYADQIQFDARYNAVILGGSCDQKFTVGIGKL